LYFYKDGIIVNHTGSWLAGVDNARPGMIMSGNAEVDLKYYQEVAKGVDEGRAKIVSLDDIIETPAGMFQHVLKTEETTPLEPGEKEYKFYDNYYYDEGKLCAFHVCIKALWYKHLTES
jgi:hypothetical protein